MRCKLHDRVVVVKGLAVGAVGTVIDISDRFDSDWLVEFPRPVLGYDYRGIAEDTRVHSPDDYLCPLPDDADPVETETEREVTA